MDYYFSFLNLNYFFDDHFQDYRLLQNYCIYLELIKDKIIINLRENYHYFNFLFIAIFNLMNFLLLLIFIFLISILVHYILETLK
jgi:hypothetical protein